MNLLLSKFKKEDFKFYFQLVSDERVMAHLTERTFSYAEATGRFKKMIERNEENEYIGSFKISHLFTHSFIGFGHVSINEEKKDEAEIGYMIVPEYWGQGCGTEAAKRMMYSAECACMQTVTAVIDPKNISSRKILVRLGFISETIDEVDGFPIESLRRKLETIEHNGV